MGVAAEAGDPPGLLIDRFWVAVGRPRWGPSMPLSSGHGRVGGPIGWRTAHAWAPRRGATRQLVLRARAEDYAPGDTDLSWTRITHWRTLVASAPPPRT
jgi:hypothetical protein